jgi:hypothetical protein
MKPAAVIVLESLDMRSCLPKDCGNTTQRLHKSNTASKRLRRREDVTGRGIRLLAVTFDTDICSRSQYRVFAGGSQDPPPSATHLPISCTILVNELT